MEAHEMVVELESEEDAEILLEDVTDADAPSYIPRGPSAATARDRLKPLEEATLMVSKGRSVTLSGVIPLVYDLKKLIPIAATSLAATLVGLLEAKLSKKPAPHYLS
ncbi:hypothetical protein HPB50_026543 [Hyalomma asiaticum]|uniref:Uncharacterized protein n=1 Tax=Hyalomma asiaticum TaxID=266040 RepID=A0ACB7TRK7_HYAAI|nr:hypothetical protein HPB50_026543 [Hyalomma asiaticum]